MEGAGDEWLNTLDVQTSDLLWWPQRPFAVETGTVIATDAQPRPRSSA